MARPERSLSPPADPRPCLGPALDRILVALCRELAGLAHVDPARVLVVAAQARGAARASVRSLVEGPCPVQLRLGRRRILYELGLRPPWFRRGDVEDRLRTLVHELWHLGPRGDGDLHPARRHDGDAGGEARREVLAWTRRALAALDPLLLAPLGHDGEALLPAWVERPVRTGEPGQRVRYGARDLYLQPVRLVTAAATRTVWW